MIASDAYFQSWHNVIMGNATAMNALPPVVHVFDGGPSASGILDPARQVNMHLCPDDRIIYLRHRLRTALNTFLMPIGRLTRRNGLTAHGVS